MNYFIIGKLLNTKDSNLLGLYISRLIEKNNNSFKFNEDQINKLTNLALKIISTYEDICPERIISYFINSLSKENSVNNILNKSLNTIYSEIVNEINNCEPYSIDDIDEEFEF